MEEDTRMAMQDQLVDTIMRVLVAQPDLHYYQVYIFFLIQWNFYVCFQKDDKHCCDAT